MTHDELDQEDLPKNADEDFMREQHDDDDESDDGEQSDSPEQNLASLTLDPLDQMSLDFTLRCGILTLTLGELRRLAPGVILEVAGIAPGHATLCKGNRVVAHGELVDVDGRLGLQITRLAPLS
jgi:type III secretion protein Q